MSRWHEALRAYRRRPLVDEVAPPNDAMFILCSEHHGAAELVFACEPASVLQVLGGAGLVDDAVRATVQHAVGVAGVRHIVACGHSECRVAGNPSASRSRLLEACAMLRDDDVLGPMLREHAVSLHALWFDEQEGDVYKLHLDEPKVVEWMGDEDFARLVDRFESLAP